MATYIEMMFTREDALAIQWQIARGGMQRLIDFLPLPNGENFIILASHDNWDGYSVLVPSSHHRSHDLMFSSVDARATGRPHRLTIYNNPKDGDALLAQELGGYQISNDELRLFPESYRTLTTTEVLARGSG